MSETVDGRRFLIVTADDFGIGPATSQGILELAASRIVTGTVLLVNSPYAEEAVRAWRQGGSGLEVGWHPCLTLDRPIMPATRVPSLVNEAGRFHPLGQFIRRLWLGRICAAQVRAELRAQHQRFRDLVGHPPTLVNSHHHIQVFGLIGMILRDVLRANRPRPYFRRVWEPPVALARVPGARIKRAFLSALGRTGAQQQRRQGFPGNDSLAGITDPPCVEDPRFMRRWLTRCPGRVVELTCHPGHWDRSLVGRDCTRHDGQLQRRVREFELLRHPDFHEACRQAGFTVIAPSELVSVSVRGLAA